jgi:aspartate beta-hydroxylase
MATQADKLPALLNAAMQARQQGRGADEQKLLDEALRLAPNDPRALNARGMAALSAGDLSGARTHFAAALDNDRNAPALWMNLATACRGLGDDAGEAAALEGALALDRRHFTANLRMAELRERRGETKAAMLAWSAIVQMASALTDRPPPVAEAMERGQRFLSRQTGALQRQVDETLGERIAAMGPDRRRFDACLAHTLHGRPIYRNECSGIHYPFLPADEYFDRRHFPWLEALEAKTPVIQAEARRLLGGRLEGVRPYVRQDAGTPANKWSALNDSLDWGACFLWEYGERNEAACALYPETAAALEAIPQVRIPGRAPTAFFSILQPGKHIPPHTGVTNTRAIVHLPLIVPPGCALRVGAEIREWKVGEAFVFDDTIEHEAWNRSDEPRVVLIFDVWNPHLSAAERDLLHDFFLLVEQPRDA